MPWAMLLWVLGTAVAAPDVTLVYTGGAMGAGASRYRFPLTAELDEVLQRAGGEVRAATPVHGFLVDMPSLLVATDRSVAGAAAFVDAATMSCDEPQGAWGLATEMEWLVVEVGPVSDVLDAALLGERLPLEIHRCRTPGGDEAQIVTLRGDVPKVWRHGGFDVRLGARIDVRLGGVDSEILVVGLPRQEAPRRMTRIEDLLGDYQDGLFLDGGDFVDGASSVHPGRLSAHRELGFEMLSRLGPAAAVPGATELAAGVRVWQAEIAGLDIPYVATNWVSDDPALALPTALRRTVPSDDGPVEVLILGIVDPVVSTLLPGLADEGITLRDPTEAVNETVARLVAERPADVVVAIGHLEGRTLERLRWGLIGVDLLIGDDSAATLRVNGIDADLKPLHRHQHAAPFTLPLDGVAVAELDVGSAGLERVRVSPELIGGRDPADSAVRESVSRVRLAEYPAYDKVLIPAPPDEPFRVLSEESWSRIVCEAMLEATSADVAFLPVSSGRTALGGPLTELMVADRLASLDHVEVHRVPGGKMTDLLQEAHGMDLTHCGAATDASSPKARGRYLEVERTYLVATTDRARRTSAIGPLLASAVSSLLLDRPTMRPLETADGQAVPVSLAVLEVLRRNRDSGEADWVDAMIARSPDDRTPLWLYRVRRLSVQLQQFLGIPGTAYASVPETLATSPSSFTLGTDVDMALDYGSADTLWDTRVRGVYTRLSSAGTTSETADDLRLSTSLSVPALAFPTEADFQLVPYTELLYDTEFTPAVDANFVLLPRQSDLSLTVGLSALRWTWLRRLRLGAFVNRELATLTSKPAEWGGRLEGETQWDLATGSVRLSTQWDLQLFADTAADTAADLRLRLWSEARLQLRLTRLLHAALFGQGFVIQGRIPETRQVAASWTLGFSLDVTGAFAIGRKAR